MAFFQSLASRLRVVTMAFVVAVALAAGGCGGDDAAEERARGSADQLLALAERQMNNGNHAAAIEYYRALEIRHPFADQTREGQLGLMYAYVQDRQPDAAIDAANKFIRENPRHPRVDYAYYIRGLAYFPDGLGPVEKLFRVDPTARPQSNAVRAFDNFADLLQRFPDSEWAGDARQRMIFLRNAIASYEVNVARYYLGRRAFVAAVNRCKKVIEEYQGTPSVNEALEIMIEGYRELGLEQLAVDTERVLAENRNRP